MREMSRGFGGGGLLWWLCWQQSCRQLGKLKFEAGKKGAVNTDRGTRLGSMGGGSGLNLGEGFGR